MTLTEFTEFVMQFLSLSLFMGIVILLVRGSTLLFGRKIRAGTRYFLWILLLSRLLVPVLPSLPAAVEIPVGDVERFYHVVYGEEEGFPIQVLPESEYRMEYAIPEMISPEETPATDAVPRKNISVDLVLLVPVLWLTGAAAYLFWNLGGYLDIGIVDTMKDLIVNFIGAVVFSAVGIVYLKNRKETGLAASLIPVVETESEEEHEQ